MMTRMYPPQGQPPYQGQYPPPQQPPPGYYPRRMVSRRKMPIGLEIFHWVMILGTCGLWTPVYLSAKRKRKTVTTWK